MISDAERRARAIEGRDAVAARVDDVVHARSRAVDRAQSLAARLRPSGGLARELRERPLRAVGLAALVALAAVRWFGSSRPRRQETHDGAAPQRRGLAGAFASGIAAAAAERGGRAVVDALLSERPDSERPDGRSSRGEGSVE